MAVSLGIDIGMSNIKGVILKNDEIAARVIMPTDLRTVDAAKKCCGQLLSEAGVSSNQLDGSVVTGWGAKRVSFDFDIEHKPEVVCLCKGARRICQTSKTVIDIGAQIVKAARIDNNGKPLKFEISDKCASGAGRFLEVMSSALGLEVDKLGEIGSSALSMVPISSQCSVFGESEIISYVNTGKKLEDIVNGINNSIAQRVSSIAMRVGIRQDVVITGGVAKNHQVVEYLENILDTKFATYLLDPQIIIALGASLIAGE